MSRLCKLGLFVVVGMLALTPLAANAKPAKVDQTATAKSLAAVAAPEPRTLLSAGRIEVFAQDANSIAWVDAGHAVHVERLSTHRQAVVGWLANSVIGGGEIAAPQVALAGLRALWPQYDGGLTRETVIKTGALGERIPRGEKRASIVAVFGYSNGSGDGTYLAGLSGDRSTLVFGRAEQECSGDPCTFVAVTGGGLTRVSGRTTTSELAKVAAPALLAASNGRVAVAPAAGRAVQNFSVFHPPVPAQNGPVEVYDTAGHLLAGVSPVGTVEDVALAWPDLAALVRRADGTTAVEHYDARTGALLATAGVGPAVSSIAVGARGIVYADGSSIYLFAEQPKLLWRSTGKPFGVSIEGKRVAWAIDGGAHGYVRALTLRAAS